MFETLLIEIATTPEHCITSIAALNLNTSMKVTKLHSEELIEKWIDEGWFADVHDLLYLGPRGILEFGASLRVLHPDEVDACKLCREPIFTVCCADIFCDINDYCFSDNIAGY